MTTIRIFFEKCGESAYISLLDLQRVFHRVLKRSGLPVWYTMGFNPHIYLSFSCPLSLGQESLCESCEVKTEAESIDPAAWITMPADAADAIALYNAAEHAEVTKKTKRGHKTLDLKEHLPRIDYESAGEELHFTVKLPCGSGEALNLNPALLMDFLHENGGAPAWQCRVLRTHLYTRSGADFA